MKNFLVDLCELDWFTSTPRLSYLTHRLLFNLLLFSYNGRQHFAINFWVKVLLFDGLLGLAFLIDLTFFLFY